MTGAVALGHQRPARDHHALPLWKQYLTHIPGHLVRAAVHPLPRSQAELRAQDQQDLWVIQLGSLAEVPTPPLTVNPPKYLDVLLRHRPRSIPEGEGPFYSCGVAETAGWLTVGEPVRLVRFPDG